jgi:hypothetical protein
VVVVVGGGRPGHTKKVGPARGQGGSMKKSEKAGLTAGPPTHSCVGPGHRLGAASSRRGAPGWIFRIFQLLVKLGLAPILVQKM